MKNFSDFVKVVLVALKNYNIPLSKIVIQKTVYFIKEKGVPVGIKFVPYTYGPYSSALSCELDKMAFWDMIKLNDNNFELLNIDNQSINQELYGAVAPYIVLMTKILEENYDFDNIEIFGTVLYCIQSLLSSGEEPTIENVLNEFKGWKGDRYPDQRISEMYARLQ